MTGLKVSRGRTSLAGVIPLAPSLDTVGPMGRTALDCAAILASMSDAGAGEADALRRLLAGSDHSIAGVRIAVPRPYFFDEDHVDASVLRSVEAALEVLQGEGAVVADTDDLAGAHRAQDANTVILSTEAFAIHAERLRTRWKEYGRPTRLFLASGALVPPDDIAAAERFAGAFADRVDDLLERHDVIITPTVGAPAQPCSELAADQLIIERSHTGPWNLLGLPAIALPCGFDPDGLPLSMQIVGRSHEEATVLRVADAYQQLTAWHLLRPDAPRTVGAAVDRRAESGL